MKNSSRTFLYFLWALGFSLTSALSSLAIAASMPMEDSSATEHVQAGYTGLTLFYLLSAGSTNVYEDLVDGSNCSDFVGLRKAVCESQVHEIVTYRDESGKSLLDQYLEKSRQTTASDYLIVQKLKGLGMDVYQEKKEIGEHLLFVVLQAGKFDLLKQLLTDIKNNHPDFIKRLSKLKSKEGISLADMLLDKYPDNLQVQAVINNYKLAYKLSDLKAHTGIVYTMMKLANWEQKDPKTEL